MLGFDLAALQSQSIRIHLAYGAALADAAIGDAGPVLMEGTNLFTDPCFLVSLFNLVKHTSG